MKESDERKVRRFLTRFRSPLLLDRDAPRNFNTHVHSLSSPLRRSAGGLPPPRELFDEPPSRSLPPTVVTASHPITHSSKPKSRSVDRQSVTFSPSVRFDACKQRGNIAVPRGQGDNEEGFAAADHREAPVFRAITRPEDPASSAPDGHRLSRDSASITGMKAATHEEDIIASTGSTVGSTDSSDYQADTSISPMSSLSAFSVDFENAVDDCASSSADASLSLEMSRPGHLVAQAAPNPERTGPTDASLQLWSPLTTQELRRSDVPCAQAIAPPPGCTASVSRRAFEQRGSSPDLHWQPTSSEEESGHSDDSAAEPDAGARRGHCSGTFLKAEESLLLQDQRYIVDVSASNLEAVAINTSQMKKSSGSAAVSRPETQVSAIKKTKTSALPFHAPSSGSASNQSVWTDPAYEASVWSLPFTSSDSRLSEDLFTTPLDAAAASYVAGDAIATDSKDVRLRRGVMMVELLRDEDCVVTPSERGVTSAAVKALGAAAAEASQRGQVSKQSSMARATPVLSFASSSSDFLPSDPLPMHSHTMAARHDSTKETTAATTMASANTKKNVRDLRNVSGSDFKKIVLDHAYSAEQYVRTSLCSSEFSLSSVSDVVQLSVAASKHCPPPSAPCPPPLLLQPELKRVPFTIVPAPPPKLQPTAAAAANCPSSHPLLDAPSVSSLAPTPSAARCTSASDDPCEGGTPTATHISTDAQSMPLSGVIPSPPATPSRRPSRPSSALNSQPPDGSAGVGAEGATAKSKTPSAASLTTTLPFVVRSILTNPGNARGNHSTGTTPLPPLCAPLDAVDTQLHVLWGSAEEERAHVVQSPVYPMLKLPRGTVVGVLAHRLIGGGDTRRP
ncbi:hypothetical protein ABL78_1847 [Leptomonas seymouri]|uniref:Uncharacterized protein n=1 Tax=Leptomonas seymouri TaxID=5684 RepID=A0A0N1I6U9_LEPSE|nr:hypothetical protein ABL78_1847 [Leptomonas seymouri]|eukprot:KPI89034.1 hypothetical protein ABL78_1847 [Leptomonas seymouri]